VEEVCHRLIYCQVDKINHPPVCWVEQETVNRTTAFATTAGRYAALPGNNNNNFILLLNRTESIQIKIKKKEKTVYTINNNNNNNRIYIAPYGRNFRVAGTLDNFVTAHALRGNPAHCPVTKEVMFSSALVSLFVSRITQKLLSRFSQKSVERWYTGHGRDR